VNKILFNMPQKGEEEESFLDIVSKEYKIDRPILDVLKKHLGENLYFVLNVFAGKTIKIPNIESLDNVCLMIRLYKKMKKMLEHNIEFEEMILMLSKEFSISTNKIFRFYSDMKIRETGEKDDENNTQ